MDLTAKQISFIDSYLANQSITDACKVAGISRNTAYQYLKNDLVIAEIRQRQKDLITDTTNYLQSNLLKCSKMLLDIAEDTEIQPQYRISAINSVFNNYSRLADTNDILERLDNIEQQLNNQQDNN